MYALPYPRDLSPNSLRRLFHVLWNTPTDDYHGTLGPMLQAWIDSGGDPSELLFRVICYHQRQYGVWEQLSEARDVSGSWVVEIADAHDIAREYVAEWFGVESGDVSHLGFDGFDRRNDADQLDYVSTLSYWDTLTVQADADDPRVDDDDDPSIDDSRFECHARLLQGQSFSVERLYEEYGRLTSRESAILEESPTLSVLTREMQLHALRTLGCLRDQTTPTE